MLGSFSRHQTFHKNQPSVGGSSINVFANGDREREIGLYKTGVTCFVALK